MTTPKAVLTHTLVSYNIHGCRGTDGRHDPWRTARVLEALGANLYALQEVDSHPEVEHGLDRIDFLARTTGLKAIRGPTLLRHRGTYGNALLCRREPRLVRFHDMSTRGREPRGVIEAEFELEPERVPLRVLATHLGLRRGERRRQVDRLVELVGEDDGRSTMLVGDFNEWLPGSPGLRALRRHLATGPARRTWPSRLPVLALDRIWVRPLEILIWIQVEAGPLARVASDHLPLIAGIRLSARAAGRRGEDPGQPEARGRSVLKEVCP